MQPISPSTRFLPTTSAQHLAAVCEISRSTFFSPEIARSAGANWNPLPFSAAAEKVRFRARWAALLQGIGLWAALVVIPELKADPKLSRKITSQMEAYTDALLKAPILDHLSPDEIRDYTLLRQRFMRLGAAASTVPDKDAFARAFLSALTGKAPNEAARHAFQPWLCTSVLPTVFLQSSPRSPATNRSPTSEIRRSAETTRIKIGRHPFRCLPIFIRAEMIPDGLAF